MATSSFFYGGASAPDQNTVDELIDALNAKVTAVDEDRVAAEQAKVSAEAAASNAALSETNVAGLSAQAQVTLTEAQAAVTAANASVAGTATNAATATTKAAEAAASATAAGSSADAALVSQTAAASSATAAASSATTASSQAAAATTAKMAAEAAQTAAATSATTSATSATAASTAKTAAEAAQAASATSASTASTKASEASSSASAAASSATASASSATAASGSASTASTAATAAQAAQAAAEAVYDNFDDRYLGSKSTAPTTDNDGNALVTGALYFNSTLGQMAAWSGTAWGAIGSNPDSVLGPASSTDNAIARFDGNTGKLVQDSGVTISDTGVLTVPDTFNQATLKFGTNKGMGGFSDNAVQIFANNQPAALVGFGGGYSGVRIASDGYFAWDSTTGLTSGIDLFLLRDAAQTLAQRNGTNPQTFRLYNTYTDGSNYERGFVRWNTNVLEIGAEAVGTGTARGLAFFTNGIKRASIAAGGAIDSGFTGGDYLRQEAGDFQQLGGSGRMLLLGANAQGLRLDPNYRVSWSSTTGDAYFNIDTGLARDSAGVVKITNGSTGLGSLKANNIDFTGNLTVNGNPFSAGAKGGGTDAVFYENDQTITTNYTLGTNKNAMTTGPVTVSTGVTVTVPTGSRWVIL